MDKRLQQLQIWLTHELSLNVTSIQAASADASFRRYFRVQTNRGVYVAMDAPPELEPIDRFISIDTALSAQGVHAPKIHHHSLSQGFILLEDLGVTTFLSALKSSMRSEEQNSVSLEVDSLYRSATNALIRIQKGHIDQSDYCLAHYDAHKLVQEMDLFHEWFVAKHLGTTLSEHQIKTWNSTKNTLSNNCLQQPQVWVHRDYHSRNLMVTDQESPGVIDFQDMVMGPIGYDLASVFKDCYIEWPRADQHRWLEHYRLSALSALNLNFSLNELVRWVDFCGLQRHLKVLGIFCRLHYRDNKPDYLIDLPLVAQYILEVLPLYPELTDFQQSFLELIELATKDSA